MPPELANELRGAWAARRLRRRQAVMSFVVATLCVAMGPLLLTAMGAVPWFGCFVLWCVALVYANRTWRRGNHGLARAIGAAQREWERQQAEERVGPRVVVPLAEAGEEGEGDGEREVEEEAARREVGVRG
jgi:hypothetical protein